jgi:starch synthase (maltosyl-transferring)
VADEQTRFIEINFKKTSLVDKKTSSHPLMNMRSRSSIIIEAVYPALDAGRFPVKAIIGDTVSIGAHIFRHSHESLQVQMHLTSPHSTSPQVIPLKSDGNDNWETKIKLSNIGRYSFSFEAWVGGDKTDLTVFEQKYHIVVDPKIAEEGAWYELFVRSQHVKPNVPGTFKDATARLPDIQRMGFDVVYLTPIHPIGHTARKGPNDTLHAGPNDPGSPWAIGNEQGGHTAIDPSLGTLNDFDSFVQSAASMKMMVALDLALQCSPDHPWVKSHPEWFYHREDGTIKHAENPPFEYQDVYPLNFESAHHTDLWDAVMEIVLFWVSHGVKIFRVDNPHSKPFAFWEWLINEIKKQHPDVLFLGEAFTRPKIMMFLSKVGFSQSYTYFTWRNSKAELIEYLAELTTPEVISYFRPNFFTTTHDVLPHFLQQGDPAAFKIRLALAATLSPSYGIYNGYELLEHEALEGKEEYKDSEKFQIKTRDWNKAGHIKEFISQINKIRRENEALRHLTPLTFLKTDNEQVLAYIKTTPDHSNSIIVVVNLDPHHPQETHVQLPTAATFPSTNLLTGAPLQWNQNNIIRLEPDHSSVHIYRVEKA